MTESAPLPALGIDIAKRKFHVVLRHQDKAPARSFANAADGFDRLLAWLGSRGAARVHACMEATGGYGEELAAFLHDAGHLVSVVNPVRIVGFARSELARNKTDSADAGIIARFCESQRPATWTPLPKSARQLREMVRHLDALTTLRTQHLNRLESARDQIVRESLGRMLAQIEAEIQQLRQRIADHIDGNPTLREQRDLLLSIPGVGERTVGQVLAEFARMSRMNSAREASAYAGVTPSQRRSGHSVTGRSRMSKLGNARLRRALYFPALVASRHNPILKAFYERLLSRGKTKMQALGAVMHKLVRIIYGVLKHRRPFDPNHLQNA